MALVILWIEQAIKSCKNKSEISTANGRVFLSRQTKRIRRPLLLKQCNTVLLYSFSVFYVCT